MGELFPRMLLFLSSLGYWGFAMKHMLWLWLFLVPVSGVQSEGGDGPAVIRGRRAQVPFGLHMTPSLRPALRGLLVELMLLV